MQGNALVGGFGDVETREAADHILTELDDLSRTQEWFGAYYWLGRCERRSNRFFMAIECEREGGRSRLCRNAGEMTPMNPFTPILPVLARAAR
jgi:hypothetical protein